MKGWCWRLGCWHSQVTSLPERWRTAESRPGVQPGTADVWPAAAVSSLCFPFPHCQHLLLQQYYYYYHCLRCNCETDPCTSCCAYLTWNACPTSSYKTKEVDFTKNWFTVMLTVKKCSTSEQTTYLYSNLIALRYVWVTVLGTV